MKTLLVIFLFSLLAFCSCKKDEKSALQGCCGTPALDEDFGNAHVYLPNLFTPNGDGMNDLFTVLGNSIQQIIKIEIRNNHDVLVFHAENTPYFDPLSQWDGRVNGVVEKGLYTVFLTLEAADGTIASFTGKTCNYPCGSVEESEMVDGTNCQFPIQDDNGHFNPNLPSSESNDCYK